MKGKKKTKLEKRLMAYTAAAVGALVMAPAAEAAVIYSGPKNLTVNPKNSVTIDLNGDGINDFSFEALRLHESVYAAGYGSTLGSMSISAAGIVALTSQTSNGNGGTGIIGSVYYGSHTFLPPSNSTSNSTATSHTYVAAPGPGPSFIFEFFYLAQSGYLAARLGTGYNIQNTLQNYSWKSYGFLDAHLGAKGIPKVIPSTSFSFGNFKDEQTGCIGVRFKTDTGKQLYGWIRFQDTSAYSGVIKDWAYDDSGAPIQACGMTAQKSAVPVPALNQWGIMALIALLAGLSLKAIKEDKSKGDA